MDQLWSTGLSCQPGLIPGVPLTTGDADVVARILGAGATRWAASVGEEMAREIVRQVPELAENPAHFQGLRRGTTSTVLRALLLVAGETTERLMNEASLDGTKDFARRGIALGLVLRGIRIGHSRMAQAFLAHIAAHAEDAVRAAEMQRVSHVLFEQIDGFAEAVAQEFQREHDDSVVASAAARIEAVNGVLNGGSLSTQASRALGYPLGGRHRALVVWIEGETSGAADALRTAAITLLDRLRSTHRLLLPVGAGAMWAWGTVPPETEPAESVEALSIPAGVRAALGQAGDGVAGFRDSHREARAVERLIGLNGNSLRPIVDHASVALVCLLSGDLPAARAFVRSQLGPLGAGGRRNQDLRRTLRCYLDQERSLARVSALLHISRNTVTYRIRQAEQLAGRSIDRDHQDLHAALLLCDVLGPRTAA